MAEAAELVLQVEAVGKRFETPAGPIDVLRGVDFAARRGETLAVVGESGSGKSTLLSLLAGLDLPTDGRVCVEGKDLAGLGERELAAFRAARLGIVFQQFHLMESLSALENVSLPLELQRVQRAEEQALAVLEQVGLADRADHLPSRLSGGECQRVAIARALVVEPAILLADEPSGSLDVRTGDNVMRLLFELVEHKRTTLLLVTHSETLAISCKRRLHLVAGELSEA